MQQQPFYHGRACFPIFSSSQKNNTKLVAQVQVKCLLINSNSKNYYSTHFFFLFQLVVVLLEHEDDVTMNSSSSNTVFCQPYIFFLGKLYRAYFLLTYLTGNICYYCYHHDLHGNECLFLLIPKCIWRMSVKIVIFKAM